MMFMVEASNLTQIKSDSLKLTTLRTESGKDLLAARGAQAYRQGFMPHSVRGKFGFFQFVSEERLYDEISRLQVEGTIVVGVAEGTDANTSQTLDLTKKGKLQLGDFKIELLGEVKPGPNPFGDLAKAFGGTEQESPSLSLSLDGDLDKIAGIKVKVGKKDLNWRSTSSSGDHAEYEYVKAGDGKGTIEIRVWKGFREVTVPFKHNLEEKPK
jgi:hypothetical protein